MPMTWGDHVAKLRAMFPRMTQLEAKQYLSDSLMGNSSEAAWPHLITEAHIATEAAHTDGTIAVVNGSATVTGTDTGWNGGWVNRKIVIAGVVYRVLSIADATTMTLATTYAGTTASDLTYTMYRDTYAVPSDCDFGREVILLDTLDSSRIEIVDYGIFQMFQYPNPGTVGTPRCATRVSFSGGGATVAIPQLMLGPDAPDSVRLYTLVYYKKPTRPTDDAHYPLWPEDFEDMLTDRAAWKYASSPAHPHPMRFEIETRYWERYREMKRRVGGGNSVERYVMAKWPALSSRGMFINAVYTG